MPFHRLLRNGFKKTQEFYFYPLFSAIDFYICVIPVWAEDQLGSADPEQIGNQQAKGGGAHNQVGHPGGGLHSWVR